GIPRENISLLTGREEDVSGAAADEHGETHVRAERGLAVGGVVGGVAGLIIGATAITIPLLGPIAVAGPISGLITGGTIGAAAGGIIGALADMGVGEERARHYEERLQQGAYVLTVGSDEEHAYALRESMIEHGAEDVDVYPLQG
ncbi:MAG: hypothetical protein PHT33_08150, partial [bacterium]|nr:hypothetical protein [bacterium]